MAGLFAGRAAGAVGAPIGRAAAQAAGRMGSTALGVGTGFAASHPYVPAEQAKVPGYTPDYAAAIATNPGVLSTAGAGRMAVQQQDAQSGQDVGSAFVNYGGPLPAGFKDPRGYLTPDVLAAAAANPYSQTAVANRQLGLDQADLQARLAGRGMLESGDLGYGLQQLDFAKGQQDFQNAADFQSAAQKALGSYAGAVQTAAQNNANALSTAVGQEYNNPLLRPTSASTAHYVPGSYEKGTALYKGADGQMYTVDGKAYTGRTPVSSIPFATRY